MARFMKSIRIAEGLKLNFSSSGVSATVGTSGASVNVGKNGASVNVSKVPTKIIKAVKDKEKREAQKKVKAEGAGLDEKTSAMTGIHKLAPTIMSKGQYVEKGCPESLVKGADYMVDDALALWLRELNLPVETRADFEYTQGPGIVCVDLDVPEIEDIPDKSLSVTQAGTASVKSKTLKRRREEYSASVLGLVVYVAVGVFNLSPHIRTVLVSGYTQRRNKDGDLTDEFVVSVFFDREKLKAMPYASQEPLETVLAFPNRLNIATSGNMKRVTPYEVSDLSQLNDM